MGIEGILIDVSGTLVSRSGGKAEYVGGMPELFDFLRQVGIKPILVSNDYSQAQLESIVTKNAPLTGSLALTRELVGKPKGSPLWIDAACDALGVSSNQLVYVGDSKWDMITASQRDVVYFHAGWAKEHGDYGVNMSSPTELLLVLKHIFLKKERWYWELDEADGRGRPVVVRALIDGNGANLPKLKSDLMSLKSGYNVDVGPMTLREFLILHMLASMYLEGIFSGVASWCTYPGSQGGSNPLLEPLLDTAAKLFHTKLRPDMIQRHTKTVPAHRLRMKGQAPNFAHQTESILLSDDGKYAKGVKGKTALVFDDFITDGHASETSRNWLMELGAECVIVVGIGKYGDYFDIQTPAASWDPTEANKGLKFSERRVHVPANA
jgi:hypothetical protein